MSEISTLYAYSYYLIQGIDICNSNSLKDQEGMKIIIPFLDICVPYFTDNIMNSLRRVRGFNLKALMIDKHKFHSSLHLQKTRATHLPQRPWRFSASFVQLPSATSHLLWSSHTTQLWLAPLYSSCSCYIKEILNCTLLMPGNLKLPMYLLLFAFLTGFAMMRCSMILRLF